MGTKSSNPKDSVGVKKVPLHVVSAPVLLEMGLGMLEGSRKYGSHNYRSAGVRASVYYDATMRHLMGWWEGEDTDEHGINHITKALTSLAVLRDSMIRGNWTDDRPLKSPKGWMDALNEKAQELVKKYPHPVKPFTER